MCIHASDTRTHQPPAGWHFAYPCPGYNAKADAEVWLLEYKGW